MRDLQLIDCICVPFPSLSSSNLAPKLGSNENDAVEPGDSKRSHLISIDSDKNQIYCVSSENLWAIGISDNKASSSKMYTTLLCKCDLLFISNQCLAYSAFFYLFLYLVLFTNKLASSIGLYHHRHHLSSCRYGIKVAKYKTYKLLLFLTFLLKSCA